MRKIQKFLEQKRMTLKSRGLKVTKNGETFEKYHILNKDNKVVLHLMESKDYDSIFYISTDGEAFMDTKGQKEAIKKLEKLMVELSQQNK